MSKPIKFTIKPAARKQHRVKISHGKSTFISESLQNESQTHEMLANMIFELSNGNFQIEKVDATGKKIKKLYYSRDKVKIVDSPYEV